jgi:hypothetical protein
MKTVLLSLLLLSIPACAKTPKSRALAGPPLPDAGSVPDAGVLRERDEKARMACLRECHIWEMQQPMGHATGPCPKKCP